MEADMPDGCREHGISAEEVDQRWFNADAVIREALVGLEGCGIGRAHV